VRLLIVRFVCDSYNFWCLNRNADQTILCALERESVDLTRIYWASVFKSGCER
jgi:hypothetical protein